MKTIAVKYQYKWDNKYNPGYVVYRAFSDLPESSWESQLVATFVFEEDASKYCEFRNKELNDD